MTEGISAFEAGRTQEHGTPGALGSGFWALTLGSMGVVYGDIGTSPLYAVREAVSAATGGAAATPDAVLGVISLILWALTIVVTLKYVVVLLRADNNGEGGTLALMALATRVGGRWAEIVAALGIIGASLFFGDALITPAISVLSAIEGLKIVTPAFDPYVVPLTIVILLALFAAQSRGTARVAAFFGPITAIWFVAIAIPGIVAIAGDPWILLAINPFYGLKFLVSHGVIGLVTLGAVFLAVTGAEALYADLGHFGRRPIQTAWLAFVFPSLRAKLSRAGGIAACGSERDRKPVLSALSELGAVADGLARNGGDRDREPGRDYGRLLAHASGDTARAVAAL